MIDRRVLPVLRGLINETPAVALTGPRQSGKTTLALQVAQLQPSVYLDLELPSDRARLADVELYLADHVDELVIFDEVHRMPGLFEVLRGIIDQGRRDGRGVGRFLLLGSASIELLSQSGETLAGRIAILELGPLDIVEAGAGREPDLWLRGGFPDSLLAGDDRRSMRWRRDFIATYLERDIPQLGPRIPAETLRRFWTMLAHHQGGMLNAAELARGLGIDGKTVARYIDLLVDLLLVRRLPPLAANIGKRLVRSPKVYVRDTGVLHGLLGLSSREELLGHPIVGPSWEGFVVEQLMLMVGRDADASFFRTSAGAEVDLVVTFAGGERWMIEVKRTLAPRVGRGFRSAWEDLGPDRGFVVCPVEARYPLADRIEAINVAELCTDVAVRFTV